MRNNLFKRYGSGAIVLILLLALVLSGIIFTANSAVSGDNSGNGSLDMVADGDSGAVSLDMTNPFVNDTKNPERINGNGQVELGYTPDANSIEIKTADQLKSWLQSGGSNVDSNSGQGQHAKLMNNIDDFAWGDNTYHIAPADAMIHRDRILDGNGYTLTIKGGENLGGTTPSDRKTPIDGNAGLLAYRNYGTVKNLNVRITGMYVYDCLLNNGDQNLGGLFAVNGESGSNKALIDNCHVVFEASMFAWGSGSGGSNHGTYFGYVAGLNYSRIHNTTVIVNKVDESKYVGDGTNSAQIFMANDTNRRLLSFGGIVGRNNNSAVMEIMNCTFHQPTAIQYRLQSDWDIEAGGIIGRIGNGYIHNAYVKSFKTNVSSNMSTKLGIIGGTIRDARHEIHHVFYTGSNCPFKVYADYEPIDNVSGDYTTSFTDVPADTTVIFDKTKTARSSDGTPVYSAGDRITFIKNISEGQLFWNVNLNSTGHSVYNEYAVDRQYNTILINADQLTDETGSTTAEQDGINGAIAISAELGTKLKVKEFTPTDSKLEQGDGNLWTKYYDGNLATADAVFTDYNGGNFTADKSSYKILYTGETEPPVLPDGNAISIGIACDNPNFVYFNERAKTVCLKADMDAPALKVQINYPAMQAKYVDYDENSWSSTGVAIKFSVQNNDGGSTDIDEFAKFTHVQYQTGNGDMWSDWSESKAIENFIFDVPCDTNTKVRFKLLNGSDTVTMISNELNPKIDNVAPNFNYTTNGESGKWWVDKENAYYFMPEAFGGVSQVAIKYHIQQGVFLEGTPKDNVFYTLRDQLTLEGGYQKRAIIFGEGIANDENFTGIDYTANGVYTLWFRGENEAGLSTISDPIIVKVDRNTYSVGVNVMYGDSPLENWENNIEIVFDNKDNLDRNTIDGAGVNKFTVAPKNDDWSIWKIGDTPLEGEEKRNRSEHSYTVELGEDEIIDGGKAFELNVVVQKRVKMITKISDKLVYNAEQNGFVVEYGEHIVVRDQYNTDPTKWDIYWDLEGDLSQEDLENLEVGLDFELCTRADEGGDHTDHEHFAAGTYKIYQTHNCKDETHDLYDIQGLLDNPKVDIPQVDGSIIIVVTPKLLGIEYQQTKAAHFSDVIDNLDYLNNIIDVTLQEASYGDNVEVTGYQLVGGAEINGGGTYTVIATLNTHNYYLENTFEVELLSMTKDESGAYIIDSMVDWEEFLYSKSGDVYYYQGENVKLDADIDFGGHVIDSVPFDYSGVFDGNGHTLSDFKIVSFAGENVGLFGVISGSVKNLNIVRASVNVYSAENVNAGILAGTVHFAENVTTDSGVISGVTVDGEIYIDSTAQVVNAGAIAGKTTGAGLSGINAVIRIKADGSGTVNAGGLIGESAQGTVTGSNVYAEYAFTMAAGRLGAIAGSADATGFSENNSFVNAKDFAGDDTQSAAAQDPMELAKKSLAINDIFVDKVRKAISKYGFTAKQVGTDSTKDQKYIYDHVIEVNTYYEYAAIDSLTFANFVLTGDIKLFREYTPGAFAFVGKLDKGEYNVI